jgi:hypothetical protein
MTKKETGYVPWRLVKSKNVKGAGFYFEKDKPNLPVKDLTVTNQGATLISGCGFELRDCDIESQCHRMKSIPSSEIQLILWYLMKLYNRQLKNTLLKYFCTDMLSDVCNT